MVTCGINDSQKKLRSPSGYNMHFVGGVLLAYLPSCIKNSHGPVMVVAVGCFRQRRRSDGFCHWSPSTDESHSVTTIFRLSRRTFDVVVFEIDKSNVSTISVIEMVAVTVKGVLVPLTDVSLMVMPLVFVDNL